MPIIISSRVRCRESATHHNLKYAEYLTEAESYHCHLEQVSGAMMDGVRGAMMDGVRGTMMDGVWRDCGYGALRCATTHPTDYLF